MRPLPYHHTLGYKVPQEIIFFILFFRLALPSPYTITLSVQGLLTNPPHSSLTPIPSYSPHLPPPHLQSNSTHRSPTYPSSLTIAHKPFMIRCVIELFIVICIITSTVLTNKITYYTRKRING